MCGLLVGCGSPPPPPAAPTETATPTPTSPTKPQKSVAGEWEDGELLGEPLVVEADLPFAEILYAARRRGATFVATGAREGDLILRTIVVTMPDDTDDIQLYGGDVLGERGSDERVEQGRYLVVGSVRGDIALSVTGPDGHARPVTGTSTSVLPGYTVFYDSGAWGDGWDQVQLAPLVIVTDDGREADVRADSWTG
jgi:hypothetical protein